jgi:hypothetical protein
MEFFKIVEVQTSEKEIQEKGEEQGLYKRLS